MTGKESETETRANLLWERVRPSLQDRFTFVRWLGAGAFGEVCEALQESTGQRVAIKLLRAGDLPGGQSRFLREMRACAALHHPHVVRLLDSGCAVNAEIDGTTPLYTVFEYVPGETLEQLLANEGMLTVRQGIDLMLQVLDALQAAHDLGIVHRDLKPSNIMVTATAGGLKAKVLDFGVAGIMRDRFDGPALTQTGDRIGTPAYCAPEQLQGGEPLSPRMDYYAWALVLVECLTGQRVFGGHALAHILQAQLSPEPVPLPSILVTHRLGNLLRWLLEKVPARRMPDVRPLLAELATLDTSDIVDSGGFLRLATSLDSSSSGAVTVVAAPGHRHDERRSTTALCCRIELLELLGALPVQIEERLDEWLTGMRQNIVEICGRYGGLPAGDTTGEQLFYFGLSPREEAGVLRAARCALEVRDLHLRYASQPHEEGWRLGIRIGLHQGMVTLHGNDDRRLPAAGSLSLRASQLCGLCAPGEIAISPQVRGLLHNTVQAVERPLGATSVILLTSPGKDEQVEAGTTIGRDRELAQMRGFWADADVRFVALCGQPGVGKSHLARAWTAALDSRPPTLRVATCMPDRQGSSLLPIFDLLRSRFGDLTSDETMNHLKSMLMEAGSASEPALPLLTALLRPGSQSFDSPISPKKRREILLGALTTVLAVMDKDPAVYLFEDLQWADPTTLEIVQGLCSRSLGVRKLVIGTVRTGLSDTANARLDLLAGAARDTPMKDLFATGVGRRIDLRELEEDASRALVQHLWGDAIEDTALFDKVVALASGLPLFLVELARSRSSSLRSLPANTTEVLQQRIDELGAARRTAQLVAVAGSGVDARFLAELQGSAGALLGDLSYLVHAGIMRLEEDGSYAFVHELLRDSAYQSIARKDRLRLHEAVARALERQEERGGQGRPWLLASHYYEAQLVTPALRHAERAATTALMQFSNLEAVSYAQTVIDPEHGWLRLVTDRSERDLIELRLLAIATTGLMQTRGWSDQEFDRACDRALLLFQSTPTEATLPLRYAMALLHFNRGYAPETGEETAPSYIEGLLSAAKTAQAASFVRLGNLMWGAFQLFHGSPELSLDTLSAVDPGPLQDAWLYGFDAHINARSVEGVARWCMGDADVLAFSDATLQLAGSCGHPGTDAMARLYQLTVLQLAGDRDAVRSRSVELLALCERYGIQGPPGYATIMLAWADDTPQVAETVLAAQLAAGQRLNRAYSEAMIAEAEIRLGRSADARRRLLRAEKIAERSERLFLPYLQYLQALCGAQETETILVGEELALRAVQTAMAQNSHGMASSLAKRYLAHMANASDRYASVEGKLRRLLTQLGDRASSVRVSPHRQAEVDSIDVRRVGPS